MNSPGVFSGHTKTAIVTLTGRLQCVRCPQRLLEDYTDFADEEQGSKNVPKSEALEARGNLWTASSAML